MIHSAALEIGAVSTSPTITDITIPKTNGCHSVAVMIRSPSLSMHQPIAGPTSLATIAPDINVTAGVTSMSTFVSFETIFPNSAPTATARNAPAGPPATSMPKPVMLAPIIPVTTLVNSTSGGLLRLHATATPIAAPI